MKPLQIYLMLVVGFLFAFRGEAIKCNYCKSHVSFEDCDKNMKHVECVEELGLDRCAKTYIKASSVTEETYKRGCQSADGCDKPPCKVYGDGTCDVYCCTGDFCNGSSVKMISVTVLFMCSGLAFLMKLMA
ncbi:hypothetical protein ACROYT_G020392 [Oculina patagonica]